MKKTADPKALRVFAEEIRVATLEEFDALGLGHVGGAMSIVETLAVLYGGEMNIDPKNPQWEDRDRFVLSKGHAGPSVYATLALKGYFPVAQLATLNRPHTDLPSHTDRNHTPGIDMTTGSLGQGASTAAGLAMAAKAMHKSYRTFLIVGDGESNEGQVWEMAQFAAHQKLDNLVLFVDWNKKQLDGTLEDISGGANFEEKFAAFGWDAQTVNGHDIPAIQAALARAFAVEGKPHCIVLDTIKGHGCDIAERTVDNHSITFKKEDILHSIELAKDVLAKAKAEVE